VVALRGAGASQGARGGAVARLAEELLVGPVLELLDRAQAASGVLDLLLSLLGHGCESVAERPAPPTSEGDAAQAAAQGTGRGARPSLCSRFDDSVPFEPLTG
jgi:hypothetical protein